MTQGEDGSFFEPRLVVVKTIGLLKGAEFCVH